MARVLPCNHKRGLASTPNMGAWKPPVMTLPDVRSKSLTRSSSNYFRVAYTEDTCRIRRTTPYWFDIKRSISKGTTL